MKPQHNKYHKRMQQKNCDLPATLRSTLPAEVHIFWYKRGMNILGLMYFQY